MIFGLVAAAGWGLADFGGAVAGRRIGSLATVVAGQSVSVVLATALVMARGQGIHGLAPYWWLVAANGLVSASAYVTHYRALELGPVAVVSPIGATYAVVGVILAVLILDERPGPIALIGAVVTVAGVMLASTDLGAVEESIHRRRPPGLPWAVASAVLFGVGAFILGYLSQRVGWETGLWASRGAQFAGFAALGAIRPSDLRGLGTNRGTVLAIAVGLADLLGVVAYSAGAERGFVSIVLIASAVFPLIAVALSIGLLRERPVPNQYAGIALVVAGLLMLGAA
jgi:drug/metabolite transporter (DMT)-like permease